MNTPSRELESVTQLNGRGQIESIYSLKDGLIRKSDIFTDERKIGDRVKSFGETIIRAFLPVGYPHSVTEDYLEYQIYDSLQAFSSSMAGLLSSRAVLQGYGVGDASATPTNALLLSILQESVGRVATILFAYRFGPALEHECKRYRFMADIFNDAAFVLDCASPAFPGSIRVTILCMSGCLRALCGVAAGGAKATLSAHFAKYGNVGDLSAKDSSQETIISLAGMLVGTLLVSQVTTVSTTWLTLLTLLGIHLYTNYRAVCAVQMRTLNRQRATIVGMHYFCSQKAPVGSRPLPLSPKAVSKHERIFASGKKIRINSGNGNAYINFGADLTYLLRDCQACVDANKLEDCSIIEILKDLLNIFQNENYIVWCWNFSTITICIKEGSSSVDMFKSWMHAMVLAGYYYPVRDGILSSAEKLERYTAKEGLQKTRMALDVVNRDFEELCKQLIELGWDLETCALLTHEMRTIRIAGEEKKTI